MRDRQRTHYASVIVAASVLVGCLHEKELHYIGKANIEHYQEVATKIEWPDIHEPTSDAVLATSSPRTVRDTSHDPTWDMSLAEAIRLALEHNDVIRTRTQFLSPVNPLYTSPERVASVYDPAITETGVTFLGLGVEPALSAFDAQFDTSMNWGRNELVQNNIFLGQGILRGGTLVQETGNFSSELDKIFGNGGRFALKHNWLYSGTNSRFQLFPSSYNGFVQAEYRQPMWAGAGVEYTRTAGPVLRSIPGITGVSQGVVVARINTDISLSDFEAAVTNMVKDVEDMYWELYLAYRSWDAEVVGLNATLSTWRDVKKKRMAGARGGGEVDEAQATENYFAAQMRAENARANLLNIEEQLRRLLGLPVNDGRVIRPSDEPVVADFSPNWQLSLIESLTRRVELRKQKWFIKSLELQLKAAKSLTHPRLDFVSSYRVNAFGDNLFGENDNDGLTQQGFASAYETLTQGNQTGWGLGFEFSLPIGQRAAHAQVQNIEFRLAKARATLAAQEFEISHELSNAFQMLDSWYRAAEIGFNRRIAADRQLHAFEKEYPDRVSLDLVLRAQSDLAQADVSFFTSIVRYNQAITDLLYRKGTLLEENNIHLEESNWTPEAYRESLRRAVARSYALDTKLLHTEPEELTVPDFVGEVQLAPPADDSGETNEPTVPPLPDTMLQPSAFNDSNDTAGDVYEGSWIPNGDR